jgi:ATP-dependent RNA helicase DeaD
MSDFSQLGVAEPIIASLRELGYEVPTPIQEQSIPVLLQGGDLLAQAQTGTGKTAAFALPILTTIDVKGTLPQVIVLVPTRELAIQVAESFYHYSKNIPQFKVLAIYGGQAFAPQLRALQRGAQVVVGTPGRVMDHLRRGSLSLEAIRTVVLDEADEMLNMGFIEDIEWILEQIKHKHQTALFSATMAPNILKITKRYLKEPTHVEIKAKSHDAILIQQKFCIVPANQKLDALALFLELEHNDATLIFTRTKISSAEVALKLAARGLAAAAINGDMRQEERERVVRQLKNGDLDIVVATEVAARGIDVGRISLVINYDIPEDPDSYVHRIGRTGRAGREGAALLFVTPRERRMLSLIENTIKRRMEEVKMPHTAQMQKFRMDSFKKQLATIMSEENLENHRALIDTIIEDMDCDAKELAAALAFIVQNNQRASARATSNQKPVRQEEGDARGSAPRRDRLSFGDRGRSERAPARSPRRDDDRRSSRPSDRSDDRRSRPSDRSDDRRSRPSDRSDDRRSSFSDRPARPSDRSDDRRARPSDRSDNRRARPSDRSDDRRARPSDRSDDRRARPSDRSDDRRSSFSDRPSENRGRAASRTTEEGRGRSGARSTAKPAEREGGLATRRAAAKPAARKPAVRKARASTSGAVTTRPPRAPRAKPSKAE